VGGGSLAIEKVQGLLRSGAMVTLVSPAPNPAVDELATRGEISLVRRDFQAVDLGGMYLVLAATEVKEANARVAQDARRAGILVNAIDDIPNCDFFAMAISRHGEAQIAVSTNGRSPVMARWLREWLDTSVPSELGSLLDILGRVRDDLRSAGRAHDYDVWRAAIDEAIVLLEAGDYPGAELTVRQALCARRPGIAGEPDSAAA
jgi:precorrin-2 dehydrogenase/sirohydrochlorin ferrochelatase